MMCKVSPGAVLFTPCQYILLFAAVIKGITPITFNHVHYNISDILHFSAEIKCTRAAPLYIYSSLINVKSRKCYTLYLVKSLKSYENMNQGIKGMAWNTIWTIFRDI